MLNTIPERKIDAGTRLGAMVLDHFIMTMIAMLFFIPGMVSMFISAFKVSREQSNPDIFGGMLYLGLWGFAVYFCKDCINGRSIAKRILKLQLIDNTTGQVASPMKCFIRNLFIVFWPIEGIVALANPSRRIGDRVAGTKLVRYDALREQPKVKLVQVLIPLAMAYALMLLFTLPFTALQNKIAGQQINYIETSYNDKESKATEKLFADSLGKDLTASVKVYDKVENKSGKYISVIFYLKENYLASDDNFDKVRLSTKQLLFSKFPQNTFVGQAKFTYESENNMETRTIQLH